MNERCLAICLIITCKEQRGHTLRLTDNTSCQLTVSVGCSPTITQNVGYITETRATHSEPCKSYQNMDGSRERFECLFDVIFTDINFSSAVLLTRRKHSITL